MEELKSKFIEAIKSIDFDKLSIYELKTVSEISESVDKMAKKDYVDMLAESMDKGIAQGISKSKTISELKQGV